jgi:branched-chain amino acid transport system permease protein
VLESGALLRYSADIRTVRMDYVNRAIELGPVVVSFGQMLAFVISIVAVGLIYLFLQRTPFGRAIRAAAQEEYAAQLVGVNPARVRVVAFALSSAAAGIAGVLLAPIFVITPGIGWNFLLFAFVAVVIGGMGSATGAVVGGMAVGVIQSVSSAYLPGTMSSVVLFGAMVVVLLTRPEGLMGERTL